MWSKRKANGLREISQLTQLTMNTHKRRKRKRGNGRSRPSREILSRIFQCQKCQLSKPGAEFNPNMLYKPNSKYVKRTCRECCERPRSQRVAPEVQSYCQSWGNLVNRELRSEMKVVNNRLLKWPFHRLEQAGLVLSDLHAKTAGFLFNDIQIKFSFSNRRQLPWTKFQQGDGVIVSRQHPLQDPKKMVFEGVVLAVTNFYILIAVQNHPKLNGTWRMDQGVCRTTYDRMKEALKKFPSQFFVGPSWLQKMLTSDSFNFTKEAYSDASRRLQSYNLQGMNKSQEAAILRGIQNNCTLIHGPPGTGKTTTAATFLHAYLKVVKKGPLLATAFSNTAVDTLLERLIAKGVKAIRIGHTARVQQNLRSATLHAKMQSHPDYYGLEQLRQEMRDLSQELRHARGRAKGMGHARKSKLYREIESLEFQITKDVIQRAEVICSTLVGVGCDALKSFTFPLILIDEASQATEPSCMIAFVHSRSDTQIVMIGDHKQLPPVVHDTEGKMKVTLFDRLMQASERGCNSITSSLLNVQYRMHPLIASWPNKQFYEGKLTDGITADTRVPPKCLPWSHKGPILFYPTFGNEETKPHNQSKFNIDEAKLVAQVTKKLLSEMKPSEVGVITPYQAQSMELKKLIPEGVEVNTVDGFQGREKEVILFSCVRSNSNGDIGFLKDYRRVNVALTRARRGLLVFGNAKTLATDPIWRSWLVFVQKNDLVFAPQTPV